MRFELCSLDVVSIPRFALRYNATNDISQLFDITGSMCPFDCVSDELVAYDDIIAVAKTGEIDLRNRGYCDQGQLTEDLNIVK